MGKKISEEIIAQIPVEFERLRNKTAVAEKLGISIGTVNKYLAIYNGAPAEVARKKNVKVDAELIVKINELYASYRNMAKVAKELNISNSSVKRHLSEENLALNQKLYDDRDALWYYIIHLFGIESEEHPVSEWNITQMNKFKKMGINYRAQLLTLKWFYEIEGHPVKSKYKTIGIIPHIYENASLYYKQQSEVQKKIEEAIEKQLEQDRVTIKYNPKDYIGRKKKQKMINIDNILGDDADDKN